MVGQIVELPKLETMSTDIRKKYHDLQDEIRKYFLEMLDGYDNDNRMNCYYPIFRNQDYFGLGEMEKPFVNQMWKEGNNVYFHIDGMDDSYTEMGEYNIDDLVEFISEIEESCGR